MISQRGAIVAFASCQWVDAVVGDNLEAVVALNDVCHPLIVPKFWSIREQSALGSEDTLIGECRVGS